MLNVFIRIRVSCRKISAIYFRLASPQSSFEKSEIEKFYKNVDVVKEDMELFPSGTVDYLIACTNKKFIY